MDGELYDTAIRWNVGDKAKLIINRDNTFMKLSNPLRDRNGGEYRLLQLCNRLGLLTLKSPIILASELMKGFSTSPVLLENGSYFDLEIVHDKRFTPQIGLRFESLVLPPKNNPTPQTSL